MATTQQASAPTAIWLVDDHLPTAAAVAEIVRGLGHVPRTFAAAELACAALEQVSERELCCVLITDLRMPGMDGLALLQRVRVQAPGVAVVVITAHGSIDDAVEAMRAGALDFLTKPLDIERVETVIRNAVVRAVLDAELVKMREENRALRAAAQSSLVFRSTAMRQVLEAAERAAASDATVLVPGESGTGKERIARLIHDSSQRAAGPFVATHLAALAEGLLESELTRPLRVQVRPRGSRAAARGGSGAARLRLAGQRARAGKCGGTAGGDGGLPDPSRGRAAAHRARAVGAAELAARGRSRSTGVSGEPGARAVAPRAETRAR